LFVSANDPKLKLTRTFPRVLAVSGDHAGDQLAPVT